MRIKLREKDDVMILDLEGNIGVDASNFVETVGWILTNKTKDIICNFEGVNLIDYVGVSIIAVTYKNVLNQKGRIVLYGVPSHIMKLFSIVGLDKVFTFYATEEQALIGIKQEKEDKQEAKDKLRRRFKRIPLNLPIKLKEKFSKDGLMFEGSVVSLSADGVFVIANKIFSIGDLLRISIELTPKSEALELDAKVVWITDKDANPDEALGMGLEFSGITSKKQEEIIEFVEKHIARPA